MTEAVLSKDEAELYDRQIRLWGIESQEKLRAANVLLIGIRGLGSEIAKNILLCGINSLTILDDGIVTQEEINKNFLLNKDSLGKKIAEAVLHKAQALNPLVKINVDSENVTTKPDDYFEKFMIVVATGLKTKTLIKIDEICREKKVKFICGDVFGMFGFAVLDLQEHNFLEEKVSLPPKKRTHDGKLQQDEKIVTKLQRKYSYPKLREVLEKVEAPEKVPKRRNVLFYLVRVLLEFRDRNGRNPSYVEREKDLEMLKEIKDTYLNDYEVKSEKLPDDVLNVIFGEVPPICAIVGGVIAQEIVKAVSGKEVPIYNLFLLDPFTFAGSEELIYPA